MTQLLCSFVSQMGQVNEGIFGKQDIKELPFMLLLVGTQHSEESRMSLLLQILR